jgi:hypothetical protein
MFLVTKFLHFREQISFLESLMIYGYANGNNDLLNCTDYLNPSAPG